MRVARRSGVVLTILTVALLLAPTAGAQPPSKLTEHVTDSGGVLTDADRAVIGSAIDRLYRDRHLQLWVVYVDNFSRFRPDNWADRTRSASALGEQDALLAVATNTKSYTFTASPRSIPADALNSLRTNKIEPAVLAKSWVAAALAAADGLAGPPSASTPTSSVTPGGAGHPAQSSKPPWALIASVVGAVLLVVVLLVLVLRARRRRVDKGAVSQDVGAAGDPVSRALSTADARLRQVSDYAARHRDTVGAEARGRVDEASSEASAARDAAATDAAAAVAHANRASTLAAEAQTLANADVAAAHNPRRRRGAAPKR